MPTATTATLFAPTPNSGLCSELSGAFLIVLDGPAPLGGLTFNVTSSVGGDVITSTPVTIPILEEVGTFTVTPGTIGSRDISITGPSGITILGSPVTYNSVGNCPDDGGGIPRLQGWSGVTQTCPPAFTISFEALPSTPEQVALYCTRSHINVAISE